VTKYIKQRLNPVTISKSPFGTASAIEMINEGNLEGYCWQSAIFLSVFFNNSDLVSRGDVILPDYYGDYFHSWIELKYKGQEYVFDPALDILRKKSDYYQELEVKLKHQIPVEIIKAELIDLVRNSQKKAIFVLGTNNIKDVFFRTNSQVIAEVRENRVKKLAVKFYSDG
jgi:hypothetical protein